MEIKENEKIDKYLDFARELKKLRNIVTMTIVVGMVSKGLERGLEELEISWKLRPFKLYHCWDWSEYWVESWRPEGTFCHSDSRERLPADAGEKNLQGV